MASGLLLVALALVPVRAGATQVGAAALELVHEDRLEAHGGYTLASLEYLLDGEPLPAQGARGAERRQGVAPGSHVLEVRAVYLGRSSLFAYVEGYRFTLRGRISFEARPGWVLRVRSTALAREGLTVGWEQRPTLRLVGEPLRVSASSPPRAPGAQATEGEVVAASYQEAGGPGASPEDKARQAIDAVLAEAARLAPPGHCALEPVYFGFADTRLTPEAQAGLRRLAECLSRQPSLRLRVRGHTDARGAELFNENMAHGRARTVAGFLWTQGVARERLLLESQGEQAPACGLPSEECYARSRRVELLAVP